METATIILNKLLFKTVNNRGTALYLSVGHLPMVRIGHDVFNFSDEDIVDRAILDELAEYFSGFADREQMEKEIVSVVRDFPLGLKFRILIDRREYLPILSFTLLPAEVKSSDDLGLDIFFPDILRQESGLLIIAGPAGSGRTAAAYALVRELSKRRGQGAVTLEKPIECLLQSKNKAIAQKEIGRDFISIPEGLEACAAADADVVYVSEPGRDIFAAMPAILDLASGNAIVILEIDADTPLAAMEKVLAAAFEFASLGSARFRLADVFAGMITQEFFAPRNKETVIARDFLPGNPVVKSLIRNGDLAQIVNMMRINQPGSLPMIR